MLTCREFMLRLKQYTDGELDDRERALADDHLLNCPNCHVIYHVLVRDHDSGKSEPRG